MKEIKLIKSRENNTWKENRKIDELKKIEKNDKNSKILKKVKKWQAKEKRKTMSKLREINVVVLERT